MISLTNGAQIPENAVKQTIEVAIDKFYASDNIRWMQYDDALSIVAIDLQYEDQHWVVPDGATVRVRMKKPDKHTVLNDVLGMDESGIVYFIATRQMTAAWGKGMLAIDVSVSGTKNSANVTVMIEENPVKDEDEQSTDEYKSLEKILEEAQAAAKIVSDNAANLQLIADNLEAVQSAGENALKAEKAAEAAQQAAQEALGFRTFFSAIAPDENSDLDPSRPMTTPSAASVTVKSKGDRIQSVQVNGFTTQAGTGDPSPENVRAISTAGMKLVKLVLDGTTNKFTEAYNPLTSTCAFRFSILPRNENLFILANVAKYAANAWSVDVPFVIGWTKADSSVPAIRLPFVGSSALDNANQYLADLYNAGDPVIVWYQPADESQATGLYIPVETQGHEYRCQCLELTAPLCDGDKVESCVPSGCDKTITIDGSTVAVTASGSNYVVTAADAAAGGNAYAEGLAYLSLTAGTIVIPATSFPASVTSAQTANVWLQSNPQKVWYKSTAYTEENDIPVQLETHVYNKMTFDGTEGFSYSPASKLIYIDFPDAVANQNTTIVCSAYTGGGAGTGENKCAINSAKDFTLYGPYESLESGVSVVTSLASAGTPVTVVYKLAIPAIYAHDTVTLVAVPYTEEDSGKSVGSYDVSSQSGTTLAVSLKAIQDGGNAKTIDGHSWEDIQKLISDAVSAAVTLAQGGMT